MIEPVIALIDRRDFLRVHRGDVARPFLLDPDFLGFERLDLLALQMQQRLQIGLIPLADFILRGLAEFLVMIGRRLPIIPCLLCFWPWP